VQVVVVVVVVVAAAVVVAVVVLLGGVGGDRRRDIEVQNGYSVTGDKFVFLSLIQGNAHHKLSAGQKNRSGAKGASKRPEDQKCFAFCFKS